MTTRTILVVAAYVAVVLGLARHVATGPFDLMTIVALSLFLLTLELPVLALYLWGSSMLADAADPWIDRLPRTVRAAVTALAWTVYVVGVVATTFGVGLALLWCVVAATAAGR